MIYGLDNASPPKILSKRNKILLKKADLAVSDWNMEKSQFLSIKLLCERIICFGTFGIKKKSVQNSSL